MNERLQPSRMHLGEGILRAARLALANRPDLQEIIDHIMDPLRKNLLPEPNDFQFRRFFIRTSPTEPQAILWELEALQKAATPGARFLSHDIDTLVVEWSAIVHHSRRHT
jgi:hypothetical protein